MTDLDALVRYARTVTTAHEWLHDLDTFDRQMIATTAANRAGTTAVEPDTVTVRIVHCALQASEEVSVLLGDTKCVYCNAEMQGDECPEPACEANRSVPVGRDHRGWIRR